MPTEIYIAVLTACSCVVVVTVLLIAATTYLVVKTNAVRQNFTTLSDDLTELIRESREAVKEMQQTAARATKPMEDIEHITSTARGWTDRTDRLIGAVAAIAEPPIFFLSRNAKTVNAIFSGVMQVLLAPKNTSPPYRESKDV